MGFTGFHAWHSSCISLVQPTLRAGGASILPRGRETGAFMKTNRVWIEIVILGTAIACVLALLFATLGAAAGAAEGEVSARQQTSAPPATTDQTYNGMVTCSRCGVKHSATLGHTASTCTRVCVHAGASFVLVD